VIARITLAGTIVATLVVSAFDAVLLLPTTAFVAWMVIGATAGPRSNARKIAIPASRWRVLSVLLVLFTAISVARSGAQSLAMSAVGRGTRVDGWVAGAQLDPGSFRINLRVAELHANRGRCASAKAFARRAAALFPEALQPKRILRRCA